MITVEDIKKSIRITHNLLDDDIQRKINAALRDMSRVGIDSKRDDPLIDNACELYCKYQYDFLGKGEEYKAHYEEARDSMSLAGDYRV